MLYYATSNVTLNCLYCNLPFKSYLDSTECPGIFLDTNALDNRSAGLFSFPAMCSHDKKISFVLTRRHPPMKLFFVFPLNRLITDVLLSHQIRTVFPDSSLAHIRNDTTRVSNSSSLILIVHCRT